MSLSLEERTNIMVRLHGEVCTVSEAARILGCHRQTVNNMVADGRLDDACKGRKIDVRSIARYIAAPARENAEARKRRYASRHNLEHVV